MATKVADAMTARPRCVTPETSVQEAARLMEQEDVGALPVLEGEQLYGMVTDRDIVIRAIAKGKDPSGMQVRDIASRDVVMVGADDKLSDALELMAAHQVRRLPVVGEDNQLVGVISQADAALHGKEKEVGEMLEDISAPPEGPRL